MTSIEEIHIPGFEKVVEAKNRSVGLHAIIAIHNTTLGPALGGTRIYPYATQEQALTDALRLAQGMTYKSAITKVGLGGGKAVIVGDHRKIKSLELLTTYADVINTLKGEYITAEDVGTTTDDIATLRRRTPYVVGLPLEYGNGEQGSGDPSAFTAWGVIRGMEAAASFLFGSPSLEGKKIAIQGLGKVGSILAGFLFWKGAKLYVADPDQKVLDRFAKLYSAKIVTPDEIHKVPCDIFSPCAMGGILNDKTIPELGCKIVAGSANNQLLAEEHAEKMNAREILYAPDYVINAGGLINVSFELLPQGYSSSASLKLVHNIGDTLTDLFELSAKEKKTPQAASIDIANHYLAEKIGKRKEALQFRL